MKNILAAILISLTSCAGLKVAPTVTNECNPTFSKVLLEKVKSDEVKDPTISTTFVYDSVTNDFPRELMCILKKQATLQGKASDGKVSFVNFYVARNMSLFHFVANTEDNILVAVQAAKNTTDGSVEIRLMVMFPLSRILSDPSEGLGAKAIVLDQRRGVMLEDKYLGLLSYLTNGKLLQEKK